VTAGRVPESTSKGGARCGSPRRGGVAAGRGSPGPRPARHYDLAGRSSLHGPERQMPAVAWRRAPKETEARPREPKIATVERREASVPRYVHASRVLRRAPERLSALRPPSFGVSEQICKTRAQKRAAGTRWAV